MNYCLHILEYALYPAVASVAILAMSCPETLMAQASPAPASQMETIQDFVARLTPEQKPRFDEGMKDFNAQRYADALAIFKEMLRQFQGDAVLSKLAGEAAINSGDTSFTLSAVKPVAAADPNDWQAAALLVRACAESGDATCRDSGMAHMLDLHSRGVTPARLQQYILERVRVGENTLIVRTSLVPWGPYQVYDLGQVLNGEGQIFMRITLESNNSDQPIFAQQHPKEAAQGLRSFTIDGYRETGLNSNGQRTQTHFTYKWFMGQPSYETVREEFIKIAGGNGKPLTSRPNLVVP